MKLIFVFTVHGLFCIKFVRCQFFAISGLSFSLPPYPPPPFSLNRGRPWDTHAFPCSHATFFLPRTLPPHPLTTQRTLLYYNLCFQLAFVMDLLTVCSSTTNLNSNKSRVWFIHSSTQPPLIKFPRPLFFPFTSFALYLDALKGF